MPTLLIVMIVAATGVRVLERRPRRRRTRRSSSGATPADAAGVQWLDQTVHAIGLRLRRGEDGRLGLERTFRFDYSHDGSDRHVGRLVLRGDRLVRSAGR